MKKALVVIVSAFLTLTAVAGDTLIRAYPAAPIRDSLISVNELCVDGDQVRTTTPRDRCVEMDDSGICHRFVTEIYRSPLHTSVEVCGEWSQTDVPVCLTRTRAPYSFLQNYTVPVYRVGEDGGYVQIDSFSFRIPSCH